MASDMWHMTHDRWGGGEPSLKQNQLELEHLFQPTSCSWDSKNVSQIQNSVNSSSNPPQNRKKLEEKNICLLVGLVC